MQIDKTQIRDSVVAVLGNATEKPAGGRPVDANAVKMNVHAVLRGPDGAVKYEEKGGNLVTDIGDGHLSKRMHSNAEDIVTGMKLGTGVTAAAKNGAGAGMVTYITGSNEALDAAATDATKGAGAGWRTTHVCTWIAGDVTNGAITEVCLTNQTALADNTSAAADTVARYVFAVPIDKQVGDSLEVTWQIDVLGS